MSYITDSGQSILKNKGQYDVIRALSAGVTVQFMAIFNIPAEPAVNLRQVLKQIDYYNKQLDENNQYIYRIEKYSDYSAPEKTGKLGSVLHLEGAECIGKDLDILHVLYRLGLRSLGLTWNHRNQFADGVGEGDRAGGLSELGRRVIQEMEELNMIVDLAHISKKAFFDTLDLCRKPVMVSHGNVFNLCRHRRNLDDSQLHALADSGGIIGISQVMDFVKDSKPEINDLLDHFVYVADLIGVDHLALGSDFDGAENMVISDVSQYKEMEFHLSARGFTQAEIDKILSGNALAFLQQNLL